MVELGCGSAAKTSILLDALLARDGPARVRFAGIDVSGSFLAAAKQSLLASCAGLCAANVELICAEYIEGARPANTQYTNCICYVCMVGALLQHVSFAVQALYVGQSTSYAHRGRLPGSKVRAEDVRCYVRSQVCARLGAVSQRSAWCCCGWAAPWATRPRRRPSSSSATSWPPPARIRRRGSERHACSAQVSSTTLPGLLEALGLVLSHGAITLWDSATSSGGSYLADAHSADLLVLLHLGCKRGVRRASRCMTRGPLAPAGLPVC